MNLTKMVVQLIESYTKEHNRLRRARYAKHNSFLTDELKAEMAKHGFATHVQHSEYSGNKGLSRRARDSFITPDGRNTKLAFVSSGIKQRHLKEAKNQLAWNLTQGTPEYIEACNKDIADITKTPVLKELGIAWRRYIDAVIEENEAYETRWEARCAIKAFNNLKTGFAIKFGNAGHKGGSMSYIKYVVIDGDKIPLRKFLDNAVFEAIVLGT